MSCGRLQPKHLQISCVIDRSWATHESAGMKPDWQSGNNLFCIKWTNKELDMRLSKTLLKIRTIIGR